MRFGEAEQSVLQDLLTWRRDTRHFETTAVASKDLNALREAMELAPSVGNARPWRVLSVETPEIRAKVRAEFERSNESAAALYNDEERAAYQQLKLSGLDKAPVQLAVFTETSPDEGRGLGRQTMPETLAQSTAMALFCLWLTARSRNLGVGMVSILEPQRIATLLDVPDHWQFSAYLCIGHPSFADDTPLLHRAGWQENTATLWKSV